MKKIHAFFGFLLMAQFGLAQNRLEITVSNIKTSDGFILVALSNDEKTFMEKSFREGKVNAVKDKVTVVFNDLPDGKYAVRLFHDANSNNELDTNFMGIPKEGFGFGNNASGMFGPPSFSESVIEVLKDVKTEIRLKHL